MDEVLVRYDQSGQRVREFCEIHGISEHVLRYWLKLREKGSIDSRTEQPQGFSELKINKRSGGVELVLPRGIRLVLEGMEVSELAALVLELDRQQHA